MSERVGLVDMAIHESIRPSAAVWSQALSDRHRLIVEEYLVDLNVAETAKRCGVTREGAYLILRRHDVADAIDKALAERPGITRARIVEELGRIAFANMGDYVTVQNGRVNVIDHSKLTSEQLSVLSEIAETTTESGGSVKIKLHDKQAALVQLGKVLRMGVERIEMSGPEGAPIQVDDVRNRVIGRLERLRKRSEESANVDAPKTDIAADTPVPEAIETEGEE